MPGTIIKVKWPNGKVLVGPNSREFDGTVNEIPQYVQSADPNDHYRPWMEQHVGRQGWDWDWSMLDSDITNNCLSIKFRRGKEKYATMALLKWS